MNAAGWRFALDVALRDLNRSLRGLRLLFLCIFLGVATLATIGSLTRAITGEIAARGAIILGGDLQVEMTQRRATPEELGALGAAGQLSETVRMRAMARSGGAGADAVLSELKAVDGAYPLYGRLVVDGRPAMAPSPHEIFVAQQLADRLGVRRGDTIRYGNADYRVSGIVTGEPDQVGEGFRLGPVAIVSLEGLERTGLVQPGSLYTTKYRLRLASGMGPADVAEDLRARFPSASWEYRDRDRAAPGASRFFDRMGEFLTLIGLTALVIAGIGVSNGVASYLRRKRVSIGTLKMLGATSTDVGRIYLAQIALVAALAILAGLVAGALLPMLATALLVDVLPIRPELKLHAEPLATSAVFGLLMGFIFVVPPLARARLQPVASLLRDQLGERRRAGWRPLLLAGAAAAAVVALALATSDRPLFAAGVLGAIAGAILLLAAIGWIVRIAAARAPRPRRPLLRLALTGLYRPGAQTIALIVALGLALTLFVTLAAIQTSLSAEIESSIPDRAPDHFVLDIPSERRAEFEALVRAQAPQAEVNIVPALRGTITAFGGQRVAELEELPDGAWFLRGERGVTYSGQVPEGSEVVAGSWWPADYRGPPLVSVDREAAKVMAVGVGDRLTVSVLGREIEAQIASLREIHWDTMGFNYILVFAPSTLEAAPHGLGATIAMDQTRKGAVSRAIIAAFPSVSIIDVGEIITQVDRVLEQMSAAILLAASIAILAGIAVLIGALAASREARSYDSVVLKTLGATRLDILSSQALEYALLALVIAGVSLGLGLGGAWYVIAELFEFQWSPDWGAVAAVLLGGIGLTLAIALLGSLPLLRIRPAQALRQL
jgi:putative ABC transport system permease protein